MQQQNEETLINTDELAWFALQEKQWEALLPKFTFTQLVEMFPEAKHDIERNLKKEIGRCKKDLRTADDKEKSFRKNITEKQPWQNRWYWTMVCNILLVRPLCEGREQRIKRARFQLSALKGEKSGLITDADIQAAKDVPIETFLKVNGAGFAHCPFHTDNTPSLRVYKKTNRWWCFSCSTGTDVIDMAMKINGIDFHKAIQLLINK